METQIILLLFNLACFPNTWVIVLGFEVLDFDFTLKQHYQAIILKLGEK